ncbi:MAG TPA: porin family protein [Chryseosolibacter sp.]
MYNRCVGLMTILFSLFFFSQSSFAQIRLGIKGGGNLYDNYQPGTKYFVSEPGLGFHAGAYGDYVITGTLYARVEALFSTRGLNLTEPSFGERIRYERESSYLDLPVTANYYIFNKFYVHAGIMPSMFIQEYRSITRDSEGFKVEGNDQFRNYERWQFAGVAGASYNFTLFGQELEAGARYSMAFTRTNERIRDVRASRDPKYMMLQAYIAYKIFEF